MGGPDQGLAFHRNVAKVARVWDQPYLETCCRAALHRLHLCGSAGRPPGLMDDPCQRRLGAMGLCQITTDGRFIITPVGRQRHATEILKQTPASIQPAGR